MKLTITGRCTLIIAFSILLYTACSGGASAEGAEEPTELISPQNVSVLPASEVFPLFTLSATKSALKTPPLAQLPILRIHHDNAAGIEGYYAYTIDELVNNNPWRESNMPLTLPVYQNPGNYTRNGRKTEIDMAGTQAFAVELAKRLGVTEDKMTVTDNSPSPERLARMRERYEAIGREVPAYSIEPDEAVVFANGLNISVDARFEATIRLDPAIALPKQYNFTHYASFDEAVTAGNYLIKTYGALLGMRKPTLNVSGGDYDTYGRQSYNIGVYEGNGSTEEQLVNYSLCMAHFHCDDNGDLFIIRLNQGAPKHKLGEYPIISIGQARELLAQGHYFAASAEAFLGVEYVRRVELVYRAGWHNTLLPYYRFYVEVPAREMRGRNSYVAYYVPAVVATYIENMPYVSSDYGFLTADE